MSLLQISEPGMTPEPHQRRLAVGIARQSRSTISRREGLGKTVTAAEIILGAGVADCGVLVAVQKKLDFPLTPPQVVV